MAKRSRFAAPLEAKHYPELGTLRRFFAKVKENADGCWVWQGYKDASGYGQFRVGDRVVWVHRFAYALFKRRLRDGDEVDHMCHNPSCCNPEHLRRCDVTSNRVQGGRMSRPPAAYPV